MLTINLSWCSKVGAAPWVDRSWCDVWRDHRCCQQDAGGDSWWEKGATPAVEEGWLPPLPLEQYHWYTLQNVKLDDWLSLRFWLLIIWQESLSCYIHNKARKMIYINYCHKNNISDSKMSFLRLKTSGWPISRKTYCNDISRQKMPLFDKKVLTLHSYLRNNK